MTDIRRISPYLRMISDFPDRVEISTEQKLTIWEHNLWKHNNLRKWYKQSFMDL